MLSEDCFANNSIVYNKTYGDQTDPPSSVDVQRLRAHIRRIILKAKSAEASALS